MFYYINIINVKAVGYCHLGALSALPLVSRLVNPLPKSSAWTGHFQGGVKLPPRRFADPLRGTTPSPSNSPAVARLPLIMT